MTTPRQPPFHSLPIVVFFIALLFLAALLFTIKKDVFFSGDAGLKFLVIRQISRGGSFGALHLESPAWVNDIWNAGFYPFKAPFIYDEPGGKIVSFPPAFQWLNANFYRWFGYGGLYVIPCLSLIGLWFWWIVILKRVGVAPFIISTGFCVMALGSPLTIYGAVYWEHTLAILLAFSAVVYLVTRPTTYFHAITLGLLSGAAVWFRPETLLLCLLTMGMVLYNYSRNKTNVHIAFLLSMLPTISSFFLFNNIVYGNSLGAHSYQVSTSGGFIHYISEKMTVLAHINARLFIYFPAIIVVYILALVSWRRKSIVADMHTGSHIPPLKTVINQLTVIIILFSLLTPLILPNAGGKQWGPRYFLPLIPVAITTICLAATCFKIRRKLLWLLVPVILYSVYLNVYLAHTYLKNDYAYRVTPGLKLLEKKTCDVVVVQNQFIAQEFATLFEKKYIFLAENQDSFNRLIKLVKEAGASSIIYMASDSGKIMLPGNLMNNSHELVQVGAYYFAEYNLGAEPRRH